MKMKMEFYLYSYRSICGYSFTAIVSDAMRIIFTIICFVLLLSGCGTQEFDSGYGMNDNWAAEKHLIGLLAAEGFDSGFAATNRRSRDGALINFASNSASGGLAHYTLSAPRNSPGAAALLSIAGKISPDRLSALKETLQEFNATAKPVLKQKGNFVQRGDFRVRVDESAVELDNLWRPKRGL
jgi:hypothetical protein